MGTFAYLSLIPESLVVSMLPPEEFGTYLAVGTRKRSRGEAMFFRLPDDFACEGFDLEGARRRCVPHPDGTPKHSVYAGIYRVLERVPPEALGPLYLVTRDGRVLELEPGRTPTEFSDRVYLYQEICPVHPLVASTLGPSEFARFITDPGRPVSVPAICFVDLELGDLERDPAGGEAADLPYPHIDHLRDCLVDLTRAGAKPTKTVDRVHPLHVFYRVIRHGVFVGRGEAVRFWPMPSREALDRDRHDWWRSATAVALR